MAFALFPHRAEENCGADAATGKENSPFTVVEVNETDTLVHSRAIIVFHSPPHADAVASRLIRCEKHAHHQRRTENYETKMENEAVDGCCEERQKTVRSRTIRLNVKSLCAHFRILFRGMKAGTTRRRASAPTHTLARPKTGKVSPFERLHFGGDVTIWSFIDFHRLISLRNDLRTARRDTIARLDCRNFSMFRIFLSFFASHSTRNFSGNSHIAWELKPLLLAASQFEVFPLGFNLYGNIFLRSRRVFLFHLAARWEVLKRPKMPRHSVSFGRGAKAKSFNFYSPLEATLVVLRGK